jgi:succinate-semialdehyde dehydrogenase/glutarate-semialdehyde dehydrogenase
MARVDLRDELMRQVDRSIEAGAQIRWSSTQALPDVGAWFPPMILEDVVPGMSAFDEELFGPVGVLIRAESEAEAIRLANHSVYGLGAAVFTQDVERGERIARDELNAGCCVVNDFVRSDPRLPFGGIRESGYGRELGRAGLLEFTNAKTVLVEGHAPA